ncbi:glycosyl transferase family 2 [Niabella ginsenosidivorans]|uniref:Glycosyl transferase family 2 n=1 Tax=Niabella ginsenosidivorans TaxID=1176587 RepID=A0A1A9I3T7_9BACT|nr:glycosyltransferase family 2 protein [Niabella ginsenosidivorans]ANH82286.1 glycosyl transferase family 2 [Niabella ginsenosidivorans]
MKEARFTVALLISTYKWAEALEIVLKSILYQTRRPDEVIIAEDGQDPSTVFCIDRFVKRTGIPIKHVNHEDIGFRKSLILNKAIKEIESDYIIEIDGDIVMHREFIADHIKGAKKGYFVQGSRALISEWRTRELLRTKDIDSLHSFMRGITNRFNSLRIPVFSGLFVVNPRKSHNVKGCNLAFWRADYIKVNGYYSGFTGWGREDSELGERLINLGVKKKKLKLAAVTYHIYHTFNSRANLDTNEIIYRETVRFKYSYRPNGYLEA